MIFCGILLEYLPVELTPIVTKTNNKPKKLKKKRWKKKQCLNRYVHLLLVNRFLRHEASNVPYRGRNTSQGSQLAMASYAHHHFRLCILWRFTCTSTVRGYSHPLHLRKISFSTESQVSWITIITIEVLPSHNSNTCLSPTDLELTTESVDRLERNKSSTLPRSLPIHNTTNLWGIATTLLYLNWLAQRSWTAPCQPSVCLTTPPPLCHTMIWTRNVTSLDGVHCPLEGPRQTLWCKHQFLWCQNPAV